MEVKEKITNVVIKESGDYGTEVPLSVFGKTKEYFDKDAGLGTHIEAEVEVKGKEYNGKHYLNANIWKFRV